MTTTLTLDSPGAAESLARAYALLRHWSAEARQQETGISDNPGRETPIPVHAPDPSRERDTEERVAR